jgi:hypothetical protein
MHPKAYVHKGGVRILSYLTCSHLLQRLCITVCATDAAQLPGHQQTTYDTCLVASKEPNKNGATT